MQVLVIGANGKTGYRVTRRLADSPHMPVAMIRSGSQRSRFDELGTRAVLGDLEHPIDHAVCGCDALIFAAGSGGHTGKDKTVLVDQLGAIRAAVTALVHGARRFIMLSATYAAVDADTASPHYHRAKGQADHFIRNMHEVMDGQSLDWTIVHPGGLNDDPGDAGVTVQTDIACKGGTSRESLAAAMIACLDLPHTIGKSFALFDGDTPLDQALKSL